MKTNESVQYNKKKIAFVLGQMNQGGPARVFLNLMHLIGHEEYDVTLILFNPGGSLFNEVPDHVNIEYVKPRGFFCTKDENAFQYYLFAPWRFLIRVVAKLLRITCNTKYNYNWKLTQLFVANNKQRFDLAMSLIEGRSNYYLAQLSNAKIKVGRIPTDYLTAKLNADFDKPYFERLNYIATNSEYNLKVLQSIFPSIADRFLLLKTIIIPELIRKKANCKKGFTDQFSGTRVLTLSRYDHTKGTDLAIDTCELLIKKDINFRWYVMGKGPKNHYHDIIKKRQLQNHFVLLNPRSNPFPYVKECDIYIQPSKYEGSSNAVKEALVLKKPTIITNFKTAPEHITHMQNGLIAEMSAESLSDAIIALISDTRLRESIVKNLSENSEANTKEVGKILGLINKTNYKLIKHAGFHGVTT